MTLPQGVVGLVLAGGRSSRMGGGDKCLRSLGGQPILQWVLDRLKPQVSEIVINANGDPARFTAFGCPVVEDSLAGYAGPLAGIDAGFRWVAENRPAARFLATVAADTPFIPDDLVSRLAAASEDVTTLRIAQSDTGTHFVVGLWPVSLAGALRASLERGDRRVGAWTKENGAVSVHFPQASIGGQFIDPFFNINAPEDLTKAQSLLEVVVS